MGEERTIRIAGLSYRLEYKSTAELEGSWGSCDSRRQVICVCADIHPEQQRRTLIHEVIEALNYLLELQLPHPTITALEHGLHEVMADNPGLFAEDATGGAA